MHRLVLVASLAACGDPAGGPVPVDAAVVDRTPRDLADDDRPYVLAADCTGIPAWSLAPQQHLERVAAVSAREAWVVSFGTLLHLAPDGRVVTESPSGVRDVWRCPGVTWAVGDRGLVARKPDGGDWEVLDAGISHDIIDGGAGCDGDLWIGAYDVVRVHDGTAWRSIALEPSHHGDGTPIVHDAARVRGAGSYRVATSNYGETLAYFPERDTFVVVAGTDDLISDAVVFRDGTGATLYHGHALAFDRDPALDDPDSPLDGRRAARRADADIWLAQASPVRHFDGTTVLDETTPIYAEDVDARFDAVWAVGFGGAAVKSAAAWCHAAIVPEP